MSKKKNSRWLFQRFKGFFFESIFLRRVSLVSDIYSRTDDPAVAAMKMGITRSLSVENRDATKLTSVFCRLLKIFVPSSISLEAIMVKIPSSDMVDITDSRLTSFGMVTRRQNLNKYKKPSSEL